jgi:putative transposase
MKDTASRHRYPMMIIGQAIWQYHRFNQSYRDVREQLLYRGIDVSHETIRSWCNKFGKDFEKIIKKKQRKVTDKWHLDEMTMKVNGEYFILWRAVDSEGYELDVFLQKRRNTKSAIRFLSRLLQSIQSQESLLQTN